jgi:hypothetical protein
MTEFIVRVLCPFLLFRWLAGHVHWMPRLALERRARIVNRVS